MPLDPLPLEGNSLLYSSFEDDPSSDLERRRYHEAIRERQEHIRQHYPHPETEPINIPGVYEPQPGLQQAPVQQQQPTSSQQTPPSSTQPQEGGGFLSETLKATLGGVYSEIRDIITNVDRLSGAALDAVGILDDTEKNGILNLQSFLPEVAENQTLAGKLVRGLVEVGTGFILFGAVGKGVGITSKVLLGGLTSAAEASLGSKPTDENLTSTVLDFAPSLKDTPLLGPVLEFLKSDPNDGTALQILKNGIEDVLLSAGFAGAGKLASVFADNFSLSYLKNERGALGVPGGQPVEGLTNADLVQMADNALGQEVVQEGVTSSETLEQLGEGVVKEIPQESTPQQIAEVLTTSESEEQASRAISEAVHRDPHTSIEVKQTIDNGVLRHESPERITAAKESGALPKEALYHEFGNNENVVNAFVKLNLANAEDLLPVISAYIKGEIAGEDVLPALKNALDSNKKFIEYGSEHGKFLQEYAQGKGKLGSNLNIFYENLQNLTRDYADDLTQLLIPNKRGQTPLDELAKYTEKSLPNALGTVGVNLDEIGKPGWDLLLAYVKANLLSSPQTFARVAVANPVHLGWEIGTRYSAGIVTLNPQILKENNRLVHGYFKGFADLFSVLGHKIGIGGYDAEELLQQFRKAGSNYEYQHALRADQFGLTDGFLGDSVNFLGRLISFPGSLIGSIEKGFSFLTNRAFLHADSMKYAEEELLRTGVKSDAMQEYLTNYHRYFETPQAVTLEAAERFAATISQAESLSARIGFNQDLSAMKDGEFVYGGFSRKVIGGFNDWVKGHPSTRMIFPFSRTGANVLATTIENLPVLGAFTKTQRDLIAKGGEAAAYAYGRQALSVTALGTVAYLASQGVITGAPPSDPAERKIWESQGNKPYSIQVPFGDQVYQFDYRQIGEPLSVLIGIAADLNYMTSEAFEDYQKTGDPTLLEYVSAIGEATASAFAKNVGEKSFLAGFSSLVGVTQFPERNIPSYAAQFARGFIPFSGLLTTFNKAVDPSIIEAKTFSEKLAKNFAFFNPDLPRRRNLFGEPVLYSAGYTSQDISEDFAFGRFAANMISPIKIAVRDEESPQTQIFKAFKESNIAPGGFEIDSYKGVTLTAKEEEHAKIVRGTIAIGGKTLEQSLFQFINSPTFQKLAPGRGNTREAYVRQIIERYTTVALVQLGTASEHASGIHERYLKRQAERFGNKPLF